MKPQERIAAAVYGAVMTLAQPLVRARMAWRARQEAGYGSAVAERFGHYTDESSSGWVWLHAVSLGETRAAAPLIHALRQAQPGLRLLLSHGTATGRAQGAALLQPGDRQVWLPWDAPAAVARFLRHFRPRMGLLMETEVWPALIAECQAQALPLLLVNARLNARSARKARRLAWLARPAYRALRAVCAQSEADARRLRALGAPVLGVFGNLKFDATPDAALLAQGRQWRAAIARPVLMLASSREGEEAMLLERLGDLSPAARGAVQWLIVPRHPQRFEAVARQVQAAGLSLSRRSAWGCKAGPPADVWLGDSMGEMSLYYGLSDVALLGGSFAPLGGQNLIEAMACGCPVLVGPHSFNFAHAVEWACGAGAAKRVPDMATAVSQALALCADPAAQRAWRQRCLEFVAAHPNAALRTAQAIQTWL